MAEAAGAVVGCVIETYPPPRPGEGGDRNQLVGLAGSILLLMLIIVF